MKRATIRTARTIQMIVIRIHLNLLQMINLQVLKGDVNQKNEVAGRLQSKEICNKCPLMKGQKSNNAKYGNFVTEKKRQGFSIDNVIHES